jgi:hypothetical protein
MVLAEKVEKMPARLARDEAVRQFGQLQPSVFHPTHDHPQDTRAFGSTTLHPRPVHRLRAVMRGEQ